VVAVVGLILWAVPASGEPVKTGDAVPPLGVEAVLNAPDGTEFDLEALRGKVVVLEFWATWCGPCIVAIPHMNELATHFADEGADVQFVAINVGEEREVVEAFLEQRPIEGWVGLDPDSSAADAFGIKGIPHTVVIGRDGMVLARTMPMSLTVEHLEAALAGEAIDLPAPADPGIPKMIPLGNRADAGEALVEAWLRPTVEYDSNAFAMSGAQEIAFRNYEAGNIVHQFANGRIVGPPVAIEADLPEGQFDLYVRVPEARAFQVDELAWDTVAFAFGLTKYRDIRETEVYELRGIPGRADDRSTRFADGRSTSMPDYDFTDGYTIDSTRIRPGDLVFDFTNRLGRPVLEAVEDDRLFDIRVTIPPVEWGEGRETRLFDAFNTALETYGLVLVPVVRPVEHTVVRPRHDFAGERAGATTRPADRPGD
jgi:thiol-disulfide isomerase/thioredoxin